MPDTQPPASDHTELQRLRSIFQQLETKFNEIVCTEGIDAGVIFKDHESTTHREPGVDCPVYDHPYFSELGDSLMEVYELIKAGNQKFPT